METIFFLYFCPYRLYAGSVRPCSRQGVKSMHWNVFVGIKTYDIVSTADTLNSGLSSKILSDNLSSQIDEGILPILYRY